ncbi:MAG: type II toxin-antitoxin system RelE/ParE family toxin [Planctomycetes bacterium]|nr:type II toxin-antitoxin system RelE/ParE family toxin [Planctomycetota bacterium]
MSRSVRLHQEAELELVHAARWAVREWPELAVQFDEAIEALLVSLGEEPEAYAPAPDSPRGVDARHAPVGRFPYRFVFVAHPDEVLVLAFAHERRRPGYWRDRVA